MTDAQVVAPAPGFAVSSWTTANGLPQSSINDLALDREGYLWVGTMAGLARFDGDSFIAYPRNQVISSLTGVKAMATDRDGFIWVAWEHGIAQLDSTGQLNALVAPPVVWPQRLAVGNADSVWMAFYGEVWLNTAAEWHKVAQVPYGVAGEISEILVDRGGALWVGGTSGVARFNPGDGRVARLTALPGCGRVLSLAQADSGAAWVGTCDGVFRVTAAGRVQQVTFERASPLPVTALLPAGDGVLWVGDAAGAHRLEVEPLTSTQARAHVAFSHSLDLDGATVRVMRTGVNGSVWVGTTGAGLRLVRPLPVARLTLASGLVDREVHAIAPDGRGGLWVGGACGGLVQWKAGSASNVVHAPTMGLHGDCVRGLLHDHRGNLWIGELGWLVRVDATGQAATVVQVTEPWNTDVVPLLEDRAGRVWFGTSVGQLGYFGLDGTRTILPDSALPRKVIWSLAEDSAGLWVGQYGTVAHIIKDRVVASLGEAEGIPPGPIRALTFDRRGDLWIGSYGGGTARYRTGRKVERLVPGGRPFEQSVSAIVIDRADRFWFLGDFGLSMVPRSELAAAMDASRAVRGAVELGLDDGVPEGNNGFPNAWLDRTADRLWVATVDGVVSVDLSRFPRDTAAPRLRIDDVRLDGASIAIGPDSVLVPADANAVEIRFTAPTIEGRDDLRFRYRLRGHDRDWIESGSTRVARYASLAPGRYTFELAGRSQGGVEQNVPLSLVVSVQPKWWETSTARILFLLATLGLMWLAFQWLTRRLRAHANALQHEIDVRKEAEHRAAEAARDLAHVSRLATAGELATSIAHELNQPLAAVVGSAQAARRLIAGQENPGLTMLLGAIVTQSDRAAGVIRMLRGFVAKQRTTDTAVSLDTVVADTLRLLQHELMTRSVVVRVVDEHQPLGLVRGDPVQLQQVLVNLLLNAAEAMSGLPAAQRRVTVVLRPDEEDTVRISVVDSGDGLSAEALARVFEPFFTTKSGGLGLGLSLSRSIIEAHAGRLWAESVPRQGCTFHVLLPVTAA